MTTMSPENAYIVAQPSEAFQVAAEARGFLTGLGVDLAGEQQTKTKTALEFFSRAMQAA